MALAKIHQSEAQAFLEFKHRFSQFLEREQQFVRVDKVLMFVRSIDRKESMDIGIKLEDDDGANGLSEDWAEVERVCRGYDKRKTRISSTITWLIRDDRLRMNDVACMKAKVRYVSTTREGIEQGILLSSKRTMVKDKTDDLRVANTTSRVEEGFGTRLFETSSDEWVIIIESCMIEEENRCESYKH